MSSKNNNQLREKINNQAFEFGATSAGIARPADLKTSASYAKHASDPYYDIFESLPDWPEDALSILVFILIHERSKPDLDWWDPRPGGTPSNRQLMQIQKKLKTWLVEELDIQAKSLSYKIGMGGIFLKDASALAGIGVIGRNNLLLTPEYRPGVRLSPMPTDPETVHVRYCRACEFSCPVGR